jgi:hypothetical protein
MPTRAFLARQWPAHVHGCRRGEPEHAGQDRSDTLCNGRGVRAEANVQEVTRVLVGSACVGAAAWLALLRIAARHPPDPAREPDDCSSSFDAKRLIALGFMASTLCAR